MWTTYTLLLDLPLYIYHAVCQIKYGVFKQIQQPLGCNDLTL